MDDKNQKLTLFTLGNCAVGKTSFITKYVKNISNEIYNPTLGIDFFSKIIKLENGDYCKLLFYDTAGQERYKSISFNLIKNADGIFLIYDVAERSSFDEINGWIKSIKEAKGDNFPIILIGNKCDLENRVISKEEGEKLAQEQGFSFIETSCKEGINIEESVKILVDDIMKRRKSAKLKNIEGDNDNDLKNRNKIRLSIKSNTNSKKNETKKICCNQ